MEHRPKYLGAGTRLKNTPSRTLIDFAFQAELNSTRYLYEGLSYADIAHVLMLLEQRIIPDDAGRRLLESLVAIHDIKDAESFMDPQWGDLYNNRDAELQRRIGKDAGWLHAGRARREALTIAWLINLRSACISLIRDNIKLLTTFSDLAGTHIETLIPDFTYLQHAQPTTLGHYLLGFAFPILRDSERLLNEFRNLNSSPAGAASTNGTRLPLNRERMRELLGFERITTHDRDAMWQPDVGIQLMSIVVSMATSLDRLVEDLQIWTTSEFNFVELADEHCRTSVIMPNKKNPYALAFIRGKARELDGNLVSIITTNQTPSGQLDNRNAAYELLPQALQTLHGMVCLLAEVLNKMKFNTKLMHNQASTGFTFGTELADLLMQREQIDARTAHEITGALISEFVHEAQSQDNFGKRLSYLFKDKTGRKLSSNIAEIMAELEPVRIIMNRTGHGSCAPQSVRTMCDNLVETGNQLLVTLNNSVAVKTFPDILRQAVQKRLGKKW
ncbi:MAG: argininosuccinate lyase [Gammaproteobacteria bacterium]|nr:argininosuccinate lyase [Gammaproteobacteria bacterium]